MSSSSLQDVIDKVAGEIRATLEGGRFDALPSVKAALRLWLADLTSVRPDCSVCPDCGAALIGKPAMCAEHGPPEMDKDVEVTRANAKRLLEALPEGAIGKDRYNILASLANAITRILERLDDIERRLHEDEMLRLPEG